MRRASTIALALLAGIIVAAPPGAAIASTSLEAHRHHTGGHDWHVQLTYDRSAGELEMLSLYAQACDIVTLARHVRVDATGRFSFTGPLPQGRGTWQVAGRFSDVHHAAGRWAMSTRTCSVSGTYRASDASGHFVVGNMREYAPRRITGSSLEARTLRRLMGRVRRSAPRFDTVAEAEARGYRQQTFPGCPAFVHWRRHPVRRGGPYLDAAAPHSLVFWCDHGRYTLAAVMFGVTRVSPPPTFGDLVQWHKHGTKGAWMLHLWLVPGPMAAFATCAPLPALGRHLGVVRRDYVIDAESDRPCLT